MWVIEIALSLLFMYGGVNALFSEPIVVTNELLHWLTGQVALYFYAFWFFAQGLSLFLSKVTTFKRLEGWSLMAMYLTCLYVLILSMVLNGFTIGLITTIITGITSGILYLRIKYKYKE